MAKRRTEDRKREERDERPRTSIGEAVNTAIDSVANAAREAATNVGRTVASAGARGSFSSSAAASRTFDAESDAHRAFEHKVERLFDVTHWTELSGFENASFALHARDGSEVHREARVGDFVRIHLPGPLPSHWVQVEAIERGEARAWLRVRPSHDPTERPPRPEVTAHFFESSATNTFLLELAGSTVVARVEGRDEHPNVGGEVDGALAAAVNRVVAETGWGAKTEVPVLGRLEGLQQHQWDRFVRSLVDA